MHKTSSSGFKGFNLKVRTEVNALICVSCFENETFVSVFKHCGIVFATCACLRMPNGFI